jgi:nitrous oxidase accessory protein
LEISSGNAIHAWYCDSLLIEGNTVINHRDGIYLEFVDNSRILDNHSRNNLRYGLHFMFSDNDEYIGNHFESNGAGVAVMFSKHILMDRNTFSTNWGTASYGLLLKEITDGDVTNNTFIENTIGIFGESASRLNISDNDFIRNGWALRIFGSCVDDEFRRNNFISNTFDLTTNTSRNNNIYSGNYWSEYRGYDLDRDGIGDVPHRPIKLFSYVISTVPVSIVLLRSLFVDMINFAESVTPIFSPVSLLDEKPLIQKIVR